jgi:hypothetical protein
MQTTGIKRLIKNNEPTEEVEVLLGLKENVSVSKIETYCGEDGTVIKTSGFGICRVKLTINCLQDLVNGAEAWVEYIEPSAQNSKVIWDTEYEKEYNSS